MGCQTLICNICCRRAASAQKNGSVRKAGDRDNARKLLMQAVQHVAGNLLAPLPPLPAGDETSLDVEQQLIERAKHALLLCAGVAVQRFEQALAEQQEILGSLADMAIEIYAAESALLRTMKYLDGNDESTAPFRLAMTHAWCSD